MQKIIDAMMGAMVSMTGCMTEVRRQAQRKVAERSETAGRVAVFKKNLCEALLKKSFNAGHAIEIMLATAPPSTAPSGK
jgi:hypothetical protein